MCNDLMCTEKLTGIQLSLAHNAKVKTDMSKVLYKMTKKKLKKNSDSIAKTCWIYRAQIF